MANTAIRALLTVTELLLLVLAIQRARRMDRRFAAALAFICLAVIAGLPFLLVRVVGPIEEYLVTWMGAITTAGWVAIGSALLPDLVAVVRRRPQLAQASPLVVVLLVAVPAAAAARGFDFSSEPPGATSRLVASAVVALRSAGLRGCVIRPVDDTAWNAALALVNELDRAGFAPSIDPEQEYFVPPRLVRTALPSRAVVIGTGSAARELSELGLPVLARDEDALVSLASFARPFEGTRAISLLPAFALAQSGFGERREAEGASYRWTWGHDASLVLALQPGTSYRLRVVLAPAALPTPQTVEVGVNTQSIARFEIGRQPVWRTLALTLPGSLVTGQARLVFRFGSCARRGDAVQSGYLHPLAAAFRSISLEPLVGGTVYHHHTIRSAQIGHREPPGD